MFLVTTIYAFTHSGCYYQYQRYEEGEQIRTNEPCLNCTCHNQMLMCYLKVCPFIKPGPATIPPQPFCLLFA